jgi:hypothetical protein
MRTHRTPFFSPMRPLKGRSKTSLVVLHRCSPRRESASTRWRPDRSGRR